ncbi:MAG: T9SS type A sorting domain-containing protein [Bacteroidetes bacterium]|nr:T9SS type A sorting domain-containing protein [Bacteroidota bacterium]
MKKFYPLLLILFIINTSSFAQITVTGADLPQAGKIYLVGNDTIGNINIGTANTSAQTWNFNSLVNNYPKIASYSSVLPYHQFGPNFPDANLFTYGPAFMFSSFIGAGPFDITKWGYMYWKTASDGFKIIGFRTDYGMGQTNVSQNPQELLMGTPSTLNSVYNNSPRWVINLNGNNTNPDTSYIINLKKTMTCDAWGTLNTIYGSNQVIRVHEYSTRIDSINYIISGITIPVMQIKDTINNYHFWANGIGYPLAIVHCDKNNIVKDVEFLTNIYNSNQITGTVYKTDGTTKITSGKANLIAKTPIDALFGIPESVNIDNNGHFQFANVASPGNFLVLADPNPVIYPYNTPTYYGDSIYWQNAEVLNTTSDTMISINTQNDSLLAILSGNNEISGTIYTDTSLTQKLANNGPGRGVKITLEQNPGKSCYRHTTTDPNGHYSFANVPQENYKIHVEIPGLAMNSTYALDLIGIDSTCLNQDFIYDSNFVYTFYGHAAINESDKANYDVNVFPNPANESINFIVNPINSKNASKLNIIIYDITGRKIEEKEGNCFEKNIISLKNLQNGFYFYEINTTEQRLTVGIFIKN